MKYAIENGFLKTCVCTVTFDISFHAKGSHCNAGGR